MASRANRNYIDMTNAFSLGSKLFPKTIRYCCPIQCANLANLEIRVLAIGSCQRKFTARRILMPAAVAIPCK